MSLGALWDMEEEPSMWIADQWRDYELLDCGNGEKLERWGEQYLVRPDPQAIWDSPRKNPAWNGNGPTHAISAVRPAADTGRKRRFRKAGRCIIRI